VAANSAELEQVLEVSGVVGRYNGLNVERAAALWAPGGGVSLVLTWTFFSAQGTEHTSGHNSHRRHSNK
jgi:hypothetical protein